MRNYEDFLRDLTKATLDAAADPAEFDFVTEISADFPIQVLARLLDVPEEHTGQLIDWGNELIGNTDPDYSDICSATRRASSTSTCRSARPHRSRCSSTAASWPRERRGGDGTDLVSMLVNKIPEDGAGAVGAPTSTTTSCCWSSPATRPPGTPSARPCSPSSSTRTSCALQDEPALIPGAVEEFLRWASPVYHFRRTATRDVELGGTQIKDGDKVVMWFASGNRDESVFETPTTST